MCCTPSVTSPNAALRIEAQRNIERSGIQAGSTPVNGNPPAGASVQPSGAALAGGSTGFDGSSGGSFGSSAGVQFAAAGQFATGFQRF